MSDRNPKPDAEEPPTLLIEVQVIAIPRDRGYLASKNGNNKV